MTVRMDRRGRRSLQGIEQNAQDDTQKHGYITLKHPKISQKQKCTRGNYPQVHFLHELFIKLKAIKLTVDEGEHTRHSLL